MVHRTSQNEASVIGHQTARRSAPKVSHSYFVVMIETRFGLEAIVQPEITRREVVSRIKSGEYQDIAFIHFVDGLFIEDLTAELIDAAELELKTEYRDRQADKWDHARDLRKHGVA